MKIVLAPDSFKGSLSSVDVVNRMATGILQVIPEAELVKKPMADGGEGTLETLLSSKNGKRVHVKCTGPLGNKIDTYYAISGKTAIIEVAKIAGLTMVPPEQRNPDHTTSYGVGEVMHHALNQGCTEFVIALGGSATNDGGHGMLQALGVKMIDANDNEVGVFGRDLHFIRKVKAAGLDVRWNDVHVKVACDVENALCGPNGATRVYGPQKGLALENVGEYDASMNYFATLLEKKADALLQTVPGSGAAGGLGLALLFIGAELVSGAKLVAETISLEKEMKEADLIITGEGQSDEQTLYGKAPGFIALLAKKHDVPVVLLSGKLKGDLAKLNEKFTGCFSITTTPMSLEECMDNASILLYEQVIQIIHFFNSIQSRNRRS